ncbi:MAG TPA: hypothetical protein VKB08_05215 [Bradyrhizobium sp.]|nr:hypothetical protein [Bradyrhizobium sp.]
MRTFIAGVAVAAMLPLLLSSAAVRAEDAAGPKAQAVSSELSGQTRLRIYPRRRGELLPGDYYYYPGPNAVRVCQSWLQRELRPSGPVITPQMRCRWVPG